jgi:HK97 family phage prohead protease
MEEREMQPLETRTAEIFSHTDALELRAEGEGKPTWIGGYAARFNTRSRELVPGLTEIITPGAFSASLAKGRDVRALVSHDNDRLLGRTQVKTLKVWEDDKGLRFEVQMPDTTYATDLLALMKRGDIAGASFGFRVSPNGESFRNEGGGKALRELRAVELFEVSVTGSPAYDATHVSIRVDPSISQRMQAAEIFPRRAIANRYLALT